MKIYITVATLLVSVLISIAIPQQKTLIPEMDIPQSNPSTVVSKFCEASILQNVSVVDSLTTYTPKEYSVASDKEIQMYLKSKGEVMSLDVKSPETNVKNTIVEVGEFKDNAADLSYRKERNRFEAGQIASHRNYISKIIHVWVNGPESRVRVELKSKSIDTYRSVTDFLLYKEEGEWKIFKIDIPAVYAIYGIPVSEQPATLN